MEARAQTAGTETDPRPSRRRNLDDVYEEELRDGSYTLGLPHWYSLPAVLVSNFRETPRPAVAPFSESDQNGMVEEPRYPPERTSEEDDEVMMDFVSGR